MDDTPRSVAETPAVSEISARKSGNETRSRSSGKNEQSDRSSVVTGVSENSPSTNPFKMPSDNDIFLLRDKERQRKKQERLRQRNLHVHEKMTYAARINARTSAMIHPADSDEEKKSEGEDGALAVRDDPQFTLAVTRDRHVEKESLADYISKKRDMFLVQYSLGVKRDEMRKLEEIAQAEERKLELAEQYLEEDAAMFDEFLKENDKNSVEAIKIAEAETKSKLEKVAEIKRINAQMMAIKSEISKYEDTLKEYQLYRRFLDSLAPPEWREDRQKAREKRRAERRKEREEKLASQKGRTLTESKHKGSLKPALKGAKQLSRAPSQTSTSDSTRTDDSGSDSEPELYFNDPHQLLDIFAELEEQNLSLIQNSQETEEALEEMKQTIKQTKKKMDKETEILKEQIDKLNNSIKREEEKACDLEMKAKLFSYGEFKADDQEKMLSQLNTRVEDVYRNCIGDNEANINTLQMLTNIENRLEELFEMIEMMPQDKVEAAEKAKDKERRLKLREEKLEQQRLHQEDRVRKALERAKADPKKQTGKRLIYRSEPPAHKKKEDTGADQASREEEELLYFFT